MESSTEDKLVNKWVIAGLDLSLRSAGVAVIERDQSHHLYTFGYELTKKATHRDQIEQTIDIANKIMGVLKKHSVKYVGFENYGFATKGRLAMQADLGGTLKTQVYVGLGTVPILLASRSVRKYLLGKAPEGSSKEVKKKVKAFLEGVGYDNIKNFDESDALAVAWVVNDWANVRDGSLDVDRMEVLDRIDHHQSKNHKKANV